MSDHPYDWTLDAIAFERWFHDADEPNPRIDLVKDIIDDLPQPHRETLEEYYYERLSMRGIVKRHELANPFYAQQRVDDARAAFKDAWIERHGDL